jgi:DNA-binding GntR family transcriptional regulator
MNAYEAIKEAIIQGKFEPGMRLAEENLAQAFGISRTPIREAIQRLEMDGLVTPLKRGVAVSSFSKQDIRQIYDLRALLEGYAAREAAVHREIDDICVLRESLAIFSEVIAGKAEIGIVMAENRRFHDGIVRASKNEHLSFHLSKLTVLPLVYQSFHWYGEREIQLSLFAHETILAAVEAQDGERARTAMLEHIYQGRDFALKHMCSGELV